MVGRNPILDSDLLRRALRGRESVSAAELRNALGVSAATLSRVARRTTGILRFGGARSSRFAATRDVRGFGDRWSLFRTRSDGRERRLAEIVALEDRRFLVVPATDAPDWSTRGAEGGLFDDLPWFLQDVRPQGFLGRALARRVASKLGAPEDPREWGADDQVAALLSIGDDLPGDLALRKSDRPRVTFAAPDGATRRDYPKLARATLDGDVPGSSAGGEQPKFTATLSEGGGETRRVIVKFATNRTESGRRWRDLLAAEATALDTLRAEGVLAAEARILDDGDWRFLEVDRFDRVGAKGRRSAVTLSSLDAQFAGVVAGWTRAVERLVAEGVVAPAAAEVVARVDLFGEAIANTDRHFGNLAFRFEGDLPATLAPIYDMSPIAYAPGPLGPRPYETRRPQFGANVAPSALAWALAAARRFWTTLSRDDRVSKEFRSTAAASAAAIGTKRPTPEG
jgi:hypothetical protein